MGAPIFANGRDTGFASQTNVFGSQAVTVDARAVFLDTFDGVGLDTANRWTAGGTVPPTQPAGGLCLVNPGTAASASASLASQATLPPNSFQIYGYDVTLEASTIATGNHRFWGLGSQPGGWTAATPLQDAVGFEVTTAGALRAVVYSNGSVVYSSPMTVPVDGLAHRYIIFYRPGAIFFFLDSLEVPISMIPALIGPSIQALPVRVHSINGLSVTVGVPTVTLTDIAVLDPTQSSIQIADGVFPWRVATVRQASVSPTATDLALTCTPRPGLSLALTSAATTNATAVSATPVTLFGLTCSNTGAAAAYVKIYNKASAPTVGTDVPILTVPIPAAGIVVIPVDSGYRLSLGFALAITALGADTDTTVIAAAQVKVVATYL